MQERGQLEISFGMIFSIIIIIATIGIGAYIIVQFSSLQQNVTCNLFAEDLQNKIDDAWHRDRTQDRFTGKLPGSAKYVCFGNSSSTLGNVRDKVVYDSLRLYLDDEMMLLVDPLETCGNDASQFKLEHATTSNFFCIPVKGGSASLTLSYDVTKDTKVNIAP